MDLKSYYQKILLVYNLLLIISLTCLFYTESKISNNSLFPEPLSQEEELECIKRMKIEQLVVKSEHQNLGFAKKLMDEGQSVLLSRTVPENRRYRKVVKAEDVLLEV